jgi:predicted DNA-binding WGR domain protein
MVEGGKVYSATINQANLNANNNKFYIIQILINEATGSIWIWNRWGRVGVQGQNALKGPFDKKKPFQTLTQSTTIRLWKAITERLKSNMMMGRGKSSVSSKKQRSEKVGEIPALQRLMGLIFDVNVTNNTME